MKNTKILAATCWTALSACIVLTPLEAAWGPVTPVSESVSSFQSIGTDNFCRAIALWQQSDPDPTSEVTNVQSSFLPQGGTWTSPVDVDSITSPTGEPTSEAFPVLAVNPSGYAVADWTSFGDNGTSNQEGSTVQFGSSWATPLGIATNIRPGFNGVFINANGFALDLFASLRDDPSNPDSPLTVFTSTLPKGASAWSTGIPVFKAPHSSIGFNLDLNNNALATYQTGPTFGGNVPLLSSKLSFGASSWSAPLQITASAVFGGATNAIDNAGNLIAVWVSEIAGVNVLQSSILLAGASSWTAPLNIATGIVVTVFPSPSLAVVSPLVVVNPITGDATVVFETLVNGVNTIQSSSLEFGGSAWTTPITVSSTLPTSDDFFASPVVGIDYCGNVFVAWPQLENGIYVVQASILPHLGNAWTTPVTISNPGTNSVFPALSVNGEGYAVVNWINNDDSIVEATVWTPPATIIYNVAPDCNGSNVTINGDGFCGVDSVQFGGIDADFTVNSANSITATVPAGAAGTTVPVAISSGCTGGPIFGQFTYAPLPPSKFKGHIKKEKCEGRCIKKEKHHKHSSKKDSCKDQCVQQEPCKKRCIKREKCEKCTLEAKWNASPSSNVVKYNIYKRGTLVATIPADSSLRFEKKLSKCRARGYTITAVAGSCQESVHVKLKLED